MMQLSAVDEVLPFSRLLVLGLQHILVMYAGDVAVPLAADGFFSILRAYGVRFYGAGLAPTASFFVYAEKEDLATTLKKALGQLPSELGEGEAPIEP